MNITEKSASQSICEKIAQIQEDLEVTLNKIFEQAGSSIQLERQAEYIKAIEDTKQVFERFKSKYSSAILSSKSY